ncbi:MAG: S-layer homology domain-containing protein [Firmicutes bacterium]|nr:S-layer homology domain-containing protein [Bacillota bacterium]
MKRKILSLILVFAMTVSLFTVGTGAVEPTYGDTAGHWAESSIERWSGHGIIQGSNGQFDPNGQLTCAQLATILAKLLKLPAAKDAGFTDNTADAWYYDAINRCAAAGILNGNGDGTVTPEAPITRERAMVMLARALGIEPIRKPDLTKYTDAAQVSAYARGYVAALIEAGIVGGVTADELAPQDNINRASTVTILDRAISTYADKAGATVKADGKGLVLVVADDVTVTGSVDKLLVPANDIEVTVKGSKNIDDITVSGDNSKVILDNASADNVTLDGEKSAVETKNGAKIDNVIVTENAPGATVDVGSGTTVGNVENHAEDATVTGNGTVKKVESDKDITVETKNTDVKNIGDEKITVTDKRGKDTTIGTTGSGSSTTVNKGTTSSGGGGGSSSGSSHSHSYADAWSHDATHHWHASTCGHEVVSGKAEHTWNGGKVTTAATCGAAGEKTYTCTVCLATKTEEIPATGEHTPIEVSAKEATCTEAGYTAGVKCSVCGTIISGMEEIPATGHTWGNDVIIHAVSGRDGTKTRTCTSCNENKMEYIKWKFYLAATSDNIVDMTVGDDYTAVFTLPNGEDKSVNAASVTLTAKMQNVGSLGVTGVREHSVTINTGIAGVTADLETSLSNCYGFNGMTVNATIGGKACTYNFSACEDGKITATTDTEAARAAWQELTSYVTASTQEANDSYILVANGSTMQIRKELLKFEKEEDLKLDNFSEMNTLMQNVKDHVQLVASDDDFGGIKILIKTGTQLAVGQSVATLNQDVTVEVTSDDMTVREDILSNLRTLVNTGKDNKALVLGAVQMFNELVGQMNGKTINVTIQTIQ